MTLRPHGTPLTGSEARNAVDHGLLELHLDDGGYRWSFIPVAGGSFADGGSGTCTPPLPPPTTTTTTTTTVPIATSTSSHRDDHDD